MIMELDILTVKHFQEYPIWEYISCDSTKIKPVKRYPVDNMDDRIFGVQGRMFNGALIWMNFSNYYVDSKEYTDQFVLATFYHRRNDEDSIKLYRYHDSGYNNGHNPTAISKYLDMPIDDIFPIEINITHLLKRQCECSVYKLNKTPPMALTEKEWMRLAIKIN